MSCPRPPGCIVVLPFPLAWLLLWPWEQAKLRQLMKSIRNPPMLDDLPMFEAANVNHGNRKEPARRRMSHNPLAVRSSPSHPRPHHLSVRNHVLNVEAKGCERVAKKADRSL